MRRPFARALAGALTLVAGAAAAPLARMPQAAADSVVIGGQPVKVADSPWVVALASRDRFGGTRGGQFCGGVLVAPTTVVTAAHCLGRQVLGGPVESVPDLRVITGRTELRATDGREIAVRAARVNPAYDSASNAGDLAVLELAEAVPAGQVLPVAEKGHPAYEAGTEASVYGWGTPAGSATTRTACGPRGSRCSRTGSVRTRTRGTRTDSTGPPPWCARGTGAAARTPARETAADRSWRAGGSSGSCPGGAAAGGPTARACTPGSPRSSAS